MKKDYRTRQKKRWIEILTPCERTNCIHPSANYEKTGLALAGIAKTRAEATELIEKIIRQKAEKKYN